MTTAQSPKKNQPVKIQQDDSQESSIEQQIPESQGDLADRAEAEIENDIRLRVERIQRASREDTSRHEDSKK